MNNGAVTDVAALLFCERGWLITMEIRQYDKSDAEEAIVIWNEIVDAGVAFPQKEVLGIEDGNDFFESQTYTGIAVENGETVGLYILHPNNVGRCGHICNASYAVKQDMRGKGIGEQLVKHCIETAKKCGFKILQFNAVVRTNTSALKLYKKLGFTQLGIIPNGFLMKNGQYEDIIPHYIEL